MQRDWGSMVPYMGNRGYEKQRDLLYLRTVFAPWQCRAECEYAHTLGANEPG